jgi:Zn-dependent protease
MMNSPFHRGWRIAVIAGIPIYLEFSGFFALFIWASALSPKVGEWGIGLIGAMLLFLCVVLHELGHSLVGRYYGMQVNSIVLHGLGGVAYLLGTYRAPRQLWEVSLAGPLVNAILFGGLSVLSAVLRGMDGWVPLLVEQVKSFNLTMGLFNLIPTGNSPILRSSTYERSSANEGMKMLINESIQTVLPSDFA